MNVLSDPACTLQRVWHPWRAIRKREDIQVVWERMPGRAGSWCQTTKTMRIHPDLLQRERRVAATHEAIHAELGHDGCQDEATELAVRKETARRLITAAALADAILFYGEHDLAALAEELWCDEASVVLRKLHLHPAERGYLEKRLRARDGAA